MEKIGAVLDERGVQLESDFVFDFAAAVLALAADIGNLRLVFG